MLLPLANEEEVATLDEDVTEGIELVLVAQASEIVERIFAPQSFILPV